MQKTFKKVWGIITTVLVVIVAVLAILLAGVRLFGFDIYTVLSGSMEPFYHVGSVIYVKERAPEKIAVGDPITFMLNENLVATHRVIEITEDENSELAFKTKGDANDAADGGLVNYRNVLGVPCFSVPMLGYLAAYIQTPVGRYAALTAAGIVVFLVFVPDMLFGGKDKKKEAKVK